MPPRIQMTANGIVCRNGSQEVWLDPKAPVPGAVNFVSHAHTDHLPAARNGRGGDRCTLLASRQTHAIAAIRGFRLDDHSEHADGFEMVDSGHILGSKGLLFGETFYTGDVCTRDRGFLRGAKVPRCKTLITECTFGLPEFEFPSIQNVTERVNRLISEMYERSVPVVLMGYQLGKAQTLTHLFGHWMPLYFHDSVLEMNSLHGRLGVSLAGGIGHAEAESKGLLERRPWLMISPMLSEKSRFIRGLKSKYGAVTIGFSGWAKSPRFAFGRRADYSIPMSDHCDYSELLRMVRQSGAETVYTTHGFEEEFARDLQKLGINAVPLTAAGAGGPPH